MKKYFLLSILTMAIIINTSAQEKFHDFTVKDINGKDFSLSSLEGKKVLVVNTASECGFTPQYADLERLYKDYGGDNFTIIGFPANNFGKQEPGTNEEIATFCEQNFDVTFPMMSKVSVKGDDQHTLYKWLTKKSLNGVENSKVSWNFQKYMVSESGELLGHLSSLKNPYCDEITDWLAE